MKETRIEELQSRAASAGLFVTHQAPFYRFFKGTARQTYFGGHALYTIKGYANACLWLDGYRLGKDATPE